MLSLQVTSRYLDFALILALLINHGVQRPAKTKRKDNEELVDALSGDIECIIFLQGLNGDIGILASRQGHPTANLSTLHGVVRLFLDAFQEKVESELVAELIIMALKRLATKRLAISVFIVALFIRVLNKIATIVVPSSMRDIATAWLPKYGDHCSSGEACLHPFGPPCVLVEYVKLAVLALAIFVVRKERAGGASLKVVVLCDIVKSESDTCSTNLMEF
mmetsp:Transcript_11331/g.22089  ORF Transcript_11331/g.22089 Transcript_11331/m.22089 type:complete len:220 (+) Transcript_11331:597-1256(+)